MGTTTWINFKNIQNERSETSTCRMVFSFVCCRKRTQEFDKRLTAASMGEPFFGKVWTDGCSQPSVSWGSASSDYANYESKVMREQSMSVVNMYRL